MRYSDDQMPDGFTVLELIVIIVAVMILVALLYIV